MLVVTKNRTKCVGGWCAVCIDLQAVGTLEFFGELYSPFLRGVGPALEKERVLFLVTTSTCPSLQAYAGCMPSPHFAGR